MSCCYTINEYFLKIKVEEHFKNQILLKIDFSALMPWLACTVSEGCCCSCGKKLTMLFVGWTRMALQLLNALQRHCNGIATALQRHCNGIATALQRHCNGIAIAQRLPSEKNSKHGCKFETFVSAEI
jgi:hypothetical protein